MRPNFIKWGMLGALLACAGCAPHPAAAPPVLPPANWRVDLAATPAAPRQLDPVRFTVRVADDNGKPVTGAKVVVQLVMPSMDMGRNESAGLPGAPGTYSAVGRFTMPGDWQATARVSKGARAASETVSVTVH